MSRAGRDCGSADVRGHAAYVPLDRAPTPDEETRTTLRALLDAHGLRRAA